jgi:hypothetical protein
MGYLVLQVIDCLSHRHVHETSRCLLIVRQYVEGMPESTQLVDLLSVGSDSIEPTIAAGRPPLYPEVSGFWCPSLVVVHHGYDLVLVHWCAHGRGQSRPIAPRSFQREPIQFLRGQLYG